jgi:hypothetical protein
MTICLLPKYADIMLMKKLLVEALLDLREDPLKVETTYLPHQSKNVAEVECDIAPSMYSGDSVGLNPFIGVKGFNAEKGCRTCWVPSKEIKNYLQDFPLRLKEQFIQIYKEYGPKLNLHGEKTKTKEIFVELGLPETPNIDPIYLLMGEPTIQSPRDPLHMENLGAFKKEVSLFYESLTKDQKAAALQAFSKCPATKNGTRLPFGFESMSYYNGKEWKSMGWYLPYVMWAAGVHNTPKGRCLLMHVEYFRMMYSKKLSPGDVNSLTEKIKEHHVKFAVLYSGE